MLPRTTTSLIEKLWHTLPERSRTSFLKTHPLVWTLYRYLTDGIYLKPVPKGRFLATYNGMTMVIPQNDWVLIKEVLQERVYERFFSCEEANTVVDIGAHVGCFTMKAAKAVGNRGLVIAIEPEPENLAMLDENIRRNKLTNVKVINRAVGNERKLTRLYLHPYITGAHSLYKTGGYPDGVVHSDYIEIQVDTLDNISSNLGLSHIDFIKIDAEGAEVEILKGASDVLSSPNIKLAIAAYHLLPDGRAEFPEIKSYLAQMNFEVRAVDSQFMYAIKRS